MNQYKEFLKRIIVEAGEETLKYYGDANIEYAKRNEQDIVTQADLASNKKIKKAIKREYPKHRIISEEEKNYNKDAEYVWIIDPLDGTRNFKNEIPFYAVLIALTKNGKTIMGGAYFPIDKNLYFAEKGKGAYKNDKPIHCNNNGIKYSRIAGYLEPHGKQSKEVHRILDSYKENEYWLSQFGCGAYDQILVAEGKYDLMISPESDWAGIWDFAATHLIMKEAGCIVTDFYGKENDVFKSSSTLAGNPEIHKAMIEIINK